MKNKKSKLIYRDGPTDPVLEKYIMDIGKQIDITNNDGLILITGHTGIGKSTLAYHIMKYHIKDKANPKYMCGNIAMFFKTQHDIHFYEEKPKFICLDEAGDIDSRNTMTNLNKDMIAFYSKIRSANMLHVWVTPSSKIDKRIFTERLNLWINVYAKSDKFRYYIAAPQKKLKEMITDRNGIINRDDLYKLSGGRNILKGWFRRENSEGWDIYENDVKKVSTDTEIIKQANKYASELMENDKEKLYTANALSTMFKLQPSYFKKIKNENILRIMSEHEADPESYGGIHIKYKESIIPELKKYFISNRGAYHVSD